jgi:threonylcarbamoyladenosine tRNA methylthiotransferase MtaB
MPESADKTVSFHTLGCKLNSYDTEWHREQFVGAGYQVVPFGEPADVTVVNTCTVTGQGDSQSRQMLRRAHRVSPEGLVVATGCYAQTDPDAIAAMPEVDMVVGTAEKTQLLDLINDTCSLGRTFVTKSRTSDFQDMDIMNFGGRSRAFVKVQEGCNEFCSFCIIPFARGRSRSRTVASTVAQVEKLVETGYQEVVLTGVHIGDYGTDLDDRFIDLLEAVDRVEGLNRFRISSVEATFLTPEVIDFLAASDKFCRHLHVPLQSGDDGILAEMRRPYRSAFYADLLERLADQIPRIGIGADVMVGFPGESEEAFRNTFDLVESSPLVFLHVFPYSPRGNTPAAKFDNQVDPKVKKQRGAELRELSRTKLEAYQRQFLGQSLNVLFEGRREAQTGFLQGVTDNYIRVFSPGPDSVKDTVQPVTLIGLEDERVFGKIIADPGSDLTSPVLSFPGTLSSGLIAIE